MHAGFRFYAITDLLCCSAIHNPNVSPEAKKDAEKKLHDLEAGSEDKHLNNVAGGLKA
jgi:hypothetical protein